jgi:hypothetical protein
VIQGVENSAAGQMGTSNQLNGLAVAGFVLSVCCCWPVGLVLSIIGITQIKSKSNQSGQGLAIAGIVISAVGIFISLVLMLLPGFWEGFWSGFVDSYY